MFCPECGAEFRPGFDQCSDCQVQLVDALPSEPEAEPSEEIVPILEVDPLEFGRVQAILEEAGIQCFTAGDDGLGSILGSRLFSGVWVRVRRQDAPKATRLLSEI